MIANVRTFSNCHIQKEINNNIKLIPKNFDMLLAMSAYFSFLVVSNSIREERWARMFYEVW